jgi:alkanesulfonate monooxygenase SsuD/methylene tetrahydromethanopterin reductase-like flavin-dependent oxidoreductase (luciferase family)
MTLLTALATTTERVELGSLVLATSFRTPGLLAKIAATLDGVSGQRLVLGLGCGWHEPEYVAFGYPFDHRVGRFKEALAITAGLLRGERVTHHGRWSTVDDAVLLPAPARLDLPILVAAEGDRMLRLTARYAAAWQTAWYGHPDAHWRSRLERFRRSCEAEGRDPDTIEITVGVDVHGSVPGVAAGARHLPVDAGALAEGLAAWSAEGVDHAQIGLDVVTSSTVDLVLEAVERVRA